MTEVSAEVTEVRAAVAEVADPCTEVRAGVTGVRAGVTEAGAGVTEAGAGDLEVRAPRRAWRRRRSDYVGYPRPGGSGARTGAVRGDAWHASTVPVTRRGSDVVLPQIARKIGVKSIAPAPAGPIMNPMPPHGTRT